MQEKENINKDLRKAFTTQSVSAISIITNEQETNSIHEEVIIIISRSNQDQRGSI